MKKYILIQNDGEIETNSFELIGASTKRGESGKIGFFGSGLKYSIAYMMRKGIDFKVFSGDDELVFSTMPETLKGQTFDRICINGKPTSYTVTMGPTWKEDWYVLREIYCNALDEGSCQLVKETEIVQPSSGKTRIFIELTEKLRSVVNDWDSYFSDERIPLFTAKNIYTCYFAHEDVTPVNHQDVSVYHKTAGVFFRMGIRVYTQKDCLFDYGFSSVNINEDRTAKNASGFAYAVADMAANFVDENWVKAVLRTSKDDKPSYEYGSLTINGSDGPASDKWIDFSKKNILVVEEISGRYSEEISISKKEVFLLPSIFAKRIKKMHPDVIILGMGSAVGDIFSNEIEVTNKIRFLLKEVSQALSDMNYPVTHKISVVEFDDDKVLGAADKDNNRILLSSRVFDMGRREIAMTIMEETEHLNSGKEDETRAFQTHLISEWLKTMENQNGLFL